MYRVFVYGTLRAGGSNGHRMDSGRFVRRGVVQGRLYRIDWYPGLVADEAGGPVLGEVHEVDDATLRLLDEFEGLAPGAIEGSEYRRLKAPVFDPESGDRVDEAWIWEWIGAVDESRRIAGGDWLQAPGGDA